MTNPEGRRRLDDLADRQAEAGRLHVDALLDYGNAHARLLAEPNRETVTAYVLALENAVGRGTNALTRANEWLDVAADAVPYETFEKARAARDELAAKVGEQRELLEDYVARNRRSGN